MVDRRDSYDVVIAGGGVTGSATAFFLAQHPGFQGRILVCEPDPTYRFAASALSAGSIRQQFSTEINIDISLFGISFLRRLGERALQAGEPLGDGEAWSAGAPPARSTGYSRRVWVSPPLHPPLVAGADGGEEGGGRRAPSRPRQKLGSRADFQ